ncbi:hypothetical protein [Myxococcus xanthus]|uniref:hypothetical protein n=1 Tax=Myxococcus xanthus TaxID=34 RepID=UPI0011286F57|nr:hypothetical protein [Myxococcus xanthus]
MTNTDIIAVIGAAAWIPQIFALIYQFLTRPLVHILPDKKASVGFTGFGPIFNLRMAFAVDRKDAVLDGVFVEMTHEDGSKLRLDWFGTIETFSHIVGPEGIRQTVERESPPIAMKLSTFGLHDKFVRFQSRSYHDGKKPLENAFFSHLNFLKTKGGDCLGAAMESREAAELSNYYRRSFCWKAGRYDLKFGVSSPGRVGVRVRKSSFVLSQADVDGLVLNVGFVTKDFEIYAGHLAKEPREGQVPWEWREVALANGD